MRKRNGLWLPSDWDSPLSPLPWFRRHFFMPGCPCCGPVVCELFSDDCNVSDTSDVTPKWDELNGDWDYSSNRLRCVASSLTNGVCIADFISPTVNQQITCKFRTSATTAWPRVIFGYVDANNYVYLEIRVGGSGSIRIVNRVGGTETVVHSQVATASMAINTEYTLTACMTDEGRYNATVNGVSIARFTADPDTNFIGLGVNGTGTVEFDDIVISRVSASCEACDDTPSLGGCSVCGPDGFKPQQCYATPPSFSDDDYSGCDGIAGSYVLDSITGATCICNWRTEVSLASETVGGCGSGSDWTLAITARMLPRSSSTFSAALASAFPSSGSSEVFLEGLLVVSNGTCSGQWVYAKPLGYDVTGIGPVGGCGDFGNIPFDCMGELPGTSHTLSYVTATGVTGLCIRNAGDMSIEFPV